MDERAASLAKADEEEFAFQSVKSSNLGVTAMMARWHRRAKESFGEDNEITQHYAFILDVLKEQYDAIWNWDDKKEEKWKAAKKYNLELVKKYGGIKEKDITAQDHYARLDKPDGPK